CATNRRMSTGSGMTKPHVWTIVGIAAVACVGLAWASPDWNGAKSKVDQFKTKHDEIRKLAPAEARKIVAAAGAAPDAKRDSAAKSAASDARSRVNDKFRDLERLEHDTQSDLEWVIDKDATHKDEARRMKDDVKSKFDKLKDATRTLRDGNFAVIDMLARGASSARRDRQGRCDAKDVSIGSDRATCLMARGETCYVVELAADNGDAISHARDVGRRSQSQLASELQKPSSDVLKRLISERR